MKHCRDSATIYFFNTTFVCAFCRRYVPVMKYESSSDCKLMSRPYGRRKEGLTFERRAFQHSQGVFLGSIGSRQCVYIYMLNPVEEKEIILAAKLDSGLHAKPLFLSILPLAYRISNIN